MLWSRPWSALHLKLPKPDPYFTTVFPDGVACDGVLVESSKVLPALLHVDPIIAIGSALLGGGKLFIFERPASQAAGAL